MTNKYVERLFNLTSDLADGQKHETATQPNSSSLFKNEQIEEDRQDANEQILQHELVKVSSKLDFHRK